MGSVLYMWASMKFLPKFPSLECQKQAQMQVILDVKSMLCPPKLCCDISGVLHELPTCFIHNSEQLFVEGEVNIDEYLPRWSQSEYSLMFTEPEVNNCNFQS